MYDALRNLKEAPWRTVSLSPRWQQRISARPLRTQGTVPQLRPSKDQQ
ncbi:MAG: hypothetical protein AB7P18_03735 [Candidatus Binatia bacterium]